MWHEDTAATSASSGSTAAGFESGTRTDNGELDAGTTVAPSKRHSCARENLLSLNGASATRFQTTVAVEICMVAQSLKNVETQQQRLVRMLPKEPFEAQYRLASGIAINQFWSLVRAGMQRPRYGRPGKPKSPHARSLCSGQGMVEVRSQPPMLVHAEMWCRRVVS
jgi:hypothetical protein